MSLTSTDKKRKKAYALYCAYDGMMSFMAFMWQWKRAHIGIERCMHIDNLDPVALAEHPKTQKLIDADYLDPVALLLMPSYTLIATGKYQFAAAHASNRVVTALMVVLSS